MHEVVEVAGVMREYLRAVVQCLHSDISGEAFKNINDQWLLKILQGNDWWLKASSHSRLICKKLQLIYTEPAYYRNIKIWIPDVQWGRKAMPPCVQSEHFGWCVCALKNHYFVVSRCYKCTCYEVKVKQTKAAATITAEMTGLQSQDHADNIEDAQLQQYTFMGYNLPSQQLLPHGYGSKFPAFFTYKAAVENEIIDLMHPLFNNV